MSTRKPKPRFIVDDGGRVNAGLYAGIKRPGDCVVRAIAIASGLPYREVHEQLDEAKRRHVATRRTKIARQLADEASGKRKKKTKGHFREYYHDVLLALGFKWVPTMKIGQGCRVHLRREELPETGRLVVRVSRHLTAMIDGVIHDTGNPDRGGWRCVYGYYIKIK